MQVREDDVIIVYHPTRNKKVLGRVIKVADDDVHFDIADETAAWDSTRESYILPIESIFVNLGEVPRCYGKAYGVDIHPFQEKTHVKGWGDIIWMLPTTDNMVVTLHGICTDLVGMLKADKIHPFTYITLIHELEMKGGLVERGCYKYYPKKEADKVVYVVNEQVGATMHIVAHELGHGCWHRLMSDKLRGEWIDLYANSIEVYKMQGNTVKSVLADMAALSGKHAIRELAKDYKKEGADDLTVVLHRILKIIEYEHFLHRLELDTLLAGGYSIKKYLPLISDVTKGLPQTLVSDYGRHSATELWAESFGYFYADKELPENVEALMKKTLVTLQACR